MDALSPYKLTIVAVIGVTLLAAALVTLMGSLSAASTFLAFAAPTLVALLALLRGERNAENLRETKNVTAESLTQLAQAHRDDGALTLAKIAELNEKLGDPLSKPVPQVEDKPT